TPDPMVTIDPLAEESAAPDPGGSAGSSGPSLKTWIAAAVVAFLVGGGVVAVLNRSSTGTSTAAASSSNGADTGTGTAADGSANGQADGPGGRGFGRGTAGTIASIDGSSLTISGADGATTEVVTDDATVVSRSVTIGLGDIAVGDQITVMGTTTGTDVAAERIIDNGTETEPGAGAFGPRANSGQPPADGQTPPTDQSGNPVTPPSGGQFPGQGGNRPGGFVRGQVTAVSGSTLTVSSQEGTTYTVTVSSTTTVTRTQTATMADLKVGDQVSVIGQAGSDGTVTATRISEGAFVGRGFGPGAGGQGPGAAPDQGATTSTTTN
ncbi:MAG: DUF5666 domain-containing protein, partial [Acidimicrobiales bacterium]